MSLRLQLLCHLTAFHLRPETLSQLCMVLLHVHHPTWCEQVIAYTVLDINRTTRLNERPMTPEQHRQLEQMARELQGKPGVCNPIKKLLTIGLPACSSIALLSVTSVS